MSTNIPIDDHVSLLDISSEDEQDLRQNKLHYKKFEQTVTKTDINDKREVESVVENGENNLPKLQKIVEAVDLKSCDRCEYYYYYYWHL